MRRISIFAAAAFAALAMTAVAGVASASAATVLCSKPETVCADDNVRPAGQELPLAAETPLGYGKFTVRGSSGGIVECRYAVINSISSDEGGNPLQGQSEVGVYANNCEMWAGYEGAKPCESITFNSPTETYEATGGGAGTINIGSASEPLTVSFACYSPWLDEVLECSYKAKSSIPMHYAGNEATIEKAEAKTTLVSGSPCFSGGSIEAELVGDARGVFISTHTLTVLCGWNEATCANEKVQEAGANVAYGKGPAYGKFRFTGGALGVECSYAVINSVSDEKAGSPLSGQSEVGVYANNCATWQWYSKSKPCESLTISSPAETLEGTGGGAGVVNLGSESEPLAISFACFAPGLEEVVECTYQANSAIPLNIGENGYWATIAPAESVMSLVSGTAACNSTGSLVVELERAAGSFISTI